jgi:organic hydroperoxide reductase OsmC/OhrA
MLKYPMKFTVSAESPSGIQTAWKTQAKSHDQEIPVAIPPEFDGPGNGLSPEDLYAMALQNCFIATFKVFAEKSKLQFRSIFVESVLALDRNEKGHPWMAHLHLHVTLAGANQIENAQRILEKTTQSCMILNSVNTQKTFKFDLVS